VTEDESLHRYGLSPDEADLDEIRAILAVQTELEGRQQGGGDTELMRLCCVQLFNAGSLSDVPAIWRAKESSWDARCSIEVQLLCGAGLERTKQHLAAESSQTARAALDYLDRCETAGDFTAFTRENQSRWYSSYYLG